MKTIVITGSSSGRWLFTISISRSRRFFYVCILALDE